MTQEEILERIWELYRQLPTGMVKSQHYDAIVSRIRQLTDAYKAAESREDKGNEQQ